MSTKKFKRPVIFTDRVQAAWRLPEDLTPAQWADRYRILDETAAAPGAWRTDRTPYLRFPMDCFKHPKVEKITFVSSTQIGKTETFLNCIGYTIDQDPGPALVVIGRQEDAKTFGSDRLIPMVVNSPQLIKHLTGKEDDISKTRIVFDRMRIYLTGAHTPSGLASKSVRYLFFDETDKFPPFSGREADPIKLGEHRTRTFWNRKIFQASTPTTKDGYIWREKERALCFQYFVPCPHCGEYQIFTFGNLKWPAEERDPQKIKQENLAWYQCNACKEKITDVMKPQMLLAGRWVPDTCTIDKKGQILFEGVVLQEIPMVAHIAFHINSIYSPWLKFSEIAAAFLECNGDAGLLMDFFNGWMAEPWEENLGHRKPDQLLKLVMDYERATVPDGTLVLTGAVDVQKDHFYILVQGWGYNQMSHRVMMMRVETWDDVIQIMFKTDYISRTGEKFPVYLTNIDTGHRTEEVYRVCREWAGVARPIKGQQTLTGVPFRVANIDRYPHTGETIPGGLKLWHINTTYFKDKIARLVENTKQGSPGGWFLHRDPPEDYLKQFCSEHKVLVRDKKGRVKEEWRPISRATPTHYWDCEVYATAAAEMLYVHTWRPEDDQPVNKSSHQPEQPGRSGSWIQRRSSWNRRNE